MTVDLSFTQNRELSWLKFDERCLHEALDDTVPLLEKLTFLKIFCSNLDEFNMVRVGGLTDLALLNLGEVDNKSGLTSKEQLDSVFERLTDLYREKDRVYGIVENEFRTHGIFNLDIAELTKSQHKATYKYFKDFIKPILSPQVIDFEHPFPFLENLNEYLLLELERDGKTKYGIMHLPAILPKIVKLPTDTGYPFIRATKVIHEFSDECFPKFKVKNKTIIRVTRNADLSADDEIAYDDVDYRAHMKKILKKRTRLQAVRVECNQPIDKPLSDLLCQRLAITPQQIFVSDAPLSMEYVSELKHFLDDGFLKAHTYSFYAPNSASTMNLTDSVIEKVQKQDILLSYPYDSIEPFFHLLWEAAYDSRVASIKITIYRLAKNSRLVDLLCRAAENGKEVVVLMELRARFDEQHNMDNAKKLYDAGCKIIYGMAGYKVHSKICLITMSDHSGWTHITQIGTGNYNEITANLYTDFCLITADQHIGKDAMAFFQNLATGNLSGNYTHLIQSPTTLKPTLLALMDREIKKGDAGRIFLKMNAFTDRDFIDKIQEASQAGVQVRMIVRGICCLVPHIAGKTENVEIRSIVGRYLEHPRVYMFGEGYPDIYLGSADLMTRNTEHRVELLTPVLSPDIQVRLRNYMAAQFKDNVKARTIDAQGNYKFVNDGQPAFNAQAYFMQEAPVSYAKVAAKTSGGPFAFLKNLFKTKNA
ncbi:polyphosphate kinase 1 [Peptoniphilus equinus]|uniref:Polyphosphate kinase n=1 Tax=Peptoniphilus equinus TaxID=3016343 RepID=A0ABY7QSR2_9FIRM|nr:polyphosphate kinase 1 [Peptoniphilus equinus]WBW49837.1 polyphosphate kinase 1 [Peptoniphilus equinus]